MNEWKNERNFSGPLQVFEFQPCGPHLFVTCRTDNFPLSHLPIFLRSDSFITAVSSESSSYLRSSQRGLGDGLQSWSSDLAPYSVNLTMDIYSNAIQDSSRRQCLYVQHSHLFGGVIQVLKVNHSAYWMLIIQMCLVTWEISGSNEVRMNQGKGSP